MGLGGALSQTLEFGGLGVRPKPSVESQGKVCSPGGVWGLVLFFLKICALDSPQ